MKRLLGLTVILAAVFSVTYAYAQEITVDLKLCDNGGIIIGQEAEFELMTTGGLPVSKAKAVIDQKTTDISLKFNIDDYVSGAIYNFSAKSGIESIDYVSTSYTIGDRIPLNTADAMSFSMAFTPICVAKTGVRTDRVDFKFYLEKKGILQESDARFYLLDREGTLIGAKNLAIGNNDSILELSFKVPQYYTGEEFYLVLADGAKSLGYYETKYSKCAPVKIGTYADLDENGNTIIGNTFDLSLTPPYITIDAAPDSEYALYAEGKINASGQDSKTDYLIWVSKKDFTVNVFKGEKGSWDYVTSFACSVGKPSTPTIEGVFEYFQYQDRWEYDNYYCGPIMRFAPNGYAMHSTLIKYDGTFFDGRLGMEISHGCVRIAPENIKWLAENMPLKTRVYITK